MRVPHHDVAAAERVLRTGAWKRASSVVRTVVALYCGASGGIEIPLIATAPEPVNDQLPLSKSLPIYMSICELAVLTPMKYAVSLPSWTTGGAIGARRGRNPGQSRAEAQAVVEAGFRSAEDDGSTERAAIAGEMVAGEQQRILGHA